MIDTKTPKFLKDATGFCYTYTEALALRPDMTPHDGDVDARGMAADEKPAKPAKPTKPAAE